MKSIFEIGTEYIIVLSGENHGKRTLDQGSEVECITIKACTA